MLMTGWLKSLNLTTKIVTLYATGAVRAKHSTVVQSCATRDCTPPVSIWEHT